MKILSTGQQNKYFRIECTSLTFALLYQRGIQYLTDSDLDDRLRDVVGGNYELGAESIWARLAGQGVSTESNKV